MGLDTIPTRGETTITTEWFNVLKSALTLDLVPRNANGVPEDKAGSAGTVDYQFKNVRAENIYINGELVDPSLATRRPYRIGSGKATATGFPDFLTPAGSGSGLSATLDASSTDLETTINSKSVVITGSSLSYSSLTAAPGSNNTCQVNDTALAGGSETKLLGEYDEKYLAIDAIGSEISALDGTTAAFKLGTEVFLAKVDTTNNQLLPILRGWAGTDRGTISDGDTVTLLKVNALLLKSDGVTTLSSTYYPESVTTAPAAGTAGKIYFERETQKHAYDDGASISYDYLVVGYAVCDDTDCLWVHHADFDLLWKDRIAVDFRIKDSTTVALKRGSVANVQGQDVSFHENVEITQASDMDTGESAVADTVFFIYLKSDGSAVFSSVAPRKYDRLKAGFYHPLKYFRCIGSLITDGSGNWLFKRQDKKSAEEISESLVPVGSVIPWMGGYFGDGSNGSFSSVLGNSASAVNTLLPDGWRVCDGAEVNDPESPLFDGSGRYLPNLTDDRFLMGDTAAGNTGGTNSLNIDHRHNIAHVHQFLYFDSSNNRASALVQQLSQVGTYDDSNPSGANIFTENAASGSAVHGGNFSSDEEYYTAGVLDGPDGTASNANSGTMTTNVNIDPRPQWLSCIYIMRVK